MKNNRYLCFAALVLILLLCLMPAACSGNTAENGGSKAASGNTNSALSSGNSGLVSGETQINLETQAPADGTSQNPYSSDVASAGSGRDNSTSGPAKDAGSVNNTSSRGNATTQSRTESAGNGSSGGGASSPNSNESGWTEFY